jgi:multiple sugar transport system permease protein
MASLSLNRFVDRCKKWAFVSKNKRHHRMITFFHYILILSIGFMFMYPIFNMISMSFMSLEDLLNGQVHWIPSTFDLTNYQTAIRVLDIPNSLLSSLRVVFLPAISATLSSALIGYGFSRFEFPLKKMWLVLVLTVFILPSQLTLLPQFVWFRNIGLLGSVWTLILPASFGQGLFSTIYILIFYSFFNMIPKSLDEAAYIDGASEGRVFWEIGVKLSFQPLIICLAFSFVWYWNDYYRVSYLLMQTDIRTLVQMLNIFEANYTQLENIGEFTQRINEPILMAGTMLSILPLLIVYFGLQRYFVESVDSTGLTGQ